VNCCRASGTTASFQRSKTATSNIEIRLGPLEWLNEKLADLIREVPLTERTDDGEDYSYTYFLESRKAEGAITADEFDQAVRFTLPAVHQTMLDDLQLAGEELRQLEAICVMRFGPDLLSFANSREAYEDCQAFLARIVTQKQRAEIGPPDRPGFFDTDTSGQKLFGANLTGGLSEGSWAKAEQLVRGGKVSEGLAEMTRLAATEPNGRVRFHRKLLLVDICLSSKREHLAKSILEELAELIDKHHLDEWETPEIVGAVWSRLYRCYKADPASDADQAAKLFIRLCRLDPWQALACDGK
jgi:hypothetical protein